MDGKAYPAVIIVEYHLGDEYTPILGENLSIRIKVFPYCLIVSGRSPLRFGYRNIPELPYGVHPGIYLLTINSRTFSYSV